MAVPVLVNMDRGIVGQKVINNHSKSFFLFVGLTISYLCNTSEFVMPNSHVLLSTDLPEGDWEANPILT